MKITALITLLCFSFTSTVNAQTVTLAHAFTQPVEISSIWIPEEIGHIMEAHWAPPSSEGSKQAPLVVHIQDAHGAYEAQVNVKRILTHLRENYGIRLIGVEGAISRIEPKLFRFFQDHNKNLALAHRLAEKGELSGTELFALENPRAAFIHGIEDETAYRENLKRFQELLRAQDQIPDLLRQYDQPMTALKAKFFSVKLRRFDRHATRYRNGELGIQEYVRKGMPFARGVLHVDLEKIESQMEYPMLSRLLYLMRIEKILDLRKILKDAENLLARIKDRPEKVVSKTKSIVNQLERLIASKGTRDSGPEESFVSFATELYEFANEKKLDLTPYKDLRLWTSYRIQEGGIRGEALFEEIRLLTERIYEKLATTEQEKQLIRLVKDLGLLQKLMKAESTRKDFADALRRGNALRPGALADSIWKLLESGRIPKASRIKKTEILDGVMETALRFYWDASRRDARMVDNAFRLMERRKAETFAIITGGFHREGITELLKAKNVSFIVVAPRIAEVDKGSANYRQAILDVRQTIYERSGISDVVRMARDEFRRRLGSDVLHDRKLLTEEILVQVVDDLREKITERIVAEPLLGVGVKALAEALKPAIENEVARINRELTRYPGSRILGIEIGIADNGITLSANFTPDVIRLPIETLAPRRHISTPEIINQAVIERSKEPVKIAASLGDDEAALQMALQHPTVVRQAREVVQAVTAHSLGDEEARFRDTLSKIIAAEMRPAHTDDQHKQVLQRLVPFFQSNPLLTRNVLLAQGGSIPHLTTIIRHGIRHSREILTTPQGSPTPVDEAKFLVHLMSIQEEVAVAGADIDVLMGKFIAIKEEYLGRPNYRDYGEELYYLVHYKILDTIHAILFSDRYKTHNEFPGEDFESVASFLIGVMSDKRTKLYGYYWVRDLAIHLLAQYALTLDRKGLVTHVYDAMKDMASRPRTDVADVDTHLSKGPSGNQNAHDLTYSASYSLYEIRKQRVRFKLEQWAAGDHADTDAERGKLLLYYVGDEEILGLPGLNVWKQPFMDALADIFEEAAQHPDEWLERVTNILRAVRFILASSQVSGELKFIFTKLLESQAFVNLYAKLAYQGLLNDNLLLPLAGFVWDRYASELRQRLNDAAAFQEAQRSWDAATMQAETGRIDDLVRAISILSGRFYEDKALLEAFMKKPDLRHVAETQMPVLTVNAGGSSTMMDLQVAYKVLERFLWAEYKPLMDDPEVGRDKLLSYFPFAYFLPTDDDGGSTRLIKSAMLKAWGIRIVALGDPVTGVAGIVRPWMSTVLLHRIALGEGAEPQPTLESILVNGYGSVPSVFDSAKRRLELSHLPDAYKFPHDIAYWTPPATPQEVSSARGQLWARYRAQLDALTDENKAAAAGVLGARARYLQDLERFATYKDQILRITRLIDDRLVKPGIINLSDNKIGNLLALAFIIDKNGYGPNLVHHPGIKAGFDEFMRTHGLTGIPVMMSKQSNVMLARTHFMRKISQDMISHADLLPGDVITNITSYYPVLHERLPEAHYLRHAILSIWGPGSIHSSQGPSYAHDRLIDEQRAQKNEGGVGIHIVNPIIDDETQSLGGVPQYFDALLAKIPPAKRARLRDLFGYVVANDWTPILERKHPDIPTLELFLEPLLPTIPESEHTPGAMIDLAVEILNDREKGMYGPLRLQRSDREYLKRQGIGRDRIIHEYMMDAIELAQTRTGAPTPRIHYDASGVAGAAYRTVLQGPHGELVRNRLRQRLEQATSERDPEVYAKILRLRSPSRTPDGQSADASGKSLGISESVVEHLAHADATTRNQAEREIFEALSKEPGAAFRDLKSFADSRSDLKQNILTYIRRYLPVLGGARTQEDVRAVQQLIHFLGIYGAESDLDGLKGQFFIYLAYTGSPYTRYAYRTHSFLIDAIDRMYKRFAAGDERIRNDITRFFLSIANDTKSEDRPGYYWVRNKIIHLLASPVPMPSPLRERVETTGPDMNWQQSYAVNPDGTERDDIYETFKKLVTIKKPEDIAPGSTNLQEGHSASNVHDLTYAVAFALYEIRKQRILNAIQKNLPEESARRTVETDKRLLLENPQTLRSLAEQYVAALRQIPTPSEGDRQKLFHDTVAAVIETQFSHLSPRRQSELKHAILFLVHKNRRLISLNAFGTSGEDITRLHNELRSGVDHLDYAQAFPLYYLTAFYDKVEWKQAFVDALIYLLKQASTQYLTLQNAGRPTKQVADFLQQLLYGLSHILESDPSWGIPKEPFFKLLDLKSIVNNLRNIADTRSPFLSQVLAPMAQVARQLHEKPMEEMFKRIFGDEDAAEALPDIWRNYQNSTLHRELLRSAANVDTLILEINNLLGRFYLDEPLARRVNASRNIRDGIPADHVILVTQSGGGGTKFLLPISVSFLQDLVRRYQSPHFETLDLDRVFQLMKSAYFLSVDDDGGSTRLIKSAFLKHWGIKVIAPGDFMNAVSTQIAAWMNELVRHRIPANQEAVYTDRTLRSILAEGFEATPGQRIRPLDLAQQKFQQMFPGGSMEPFEEFKTKILEIVDVIDQHILQPVSGPRGQEAREKYQALFPGEPVDTFPGFLDHARELLRIYYEEVPPPTGTTGPEAAKQRFQEMFPGRPADSFDNFFRVTEEIVALTEPILNLSGSSIRNLIYIGFLIASGGYAPHVINPKGIDSANRYFADVFHLNSIPVALTDEANVIFMETDFGDLQIGQDEISHTRKSEGDKVKSTGTFYPQVFEAVNEAYMFSDSTVDAFVSSILTSFAPNLEHPDLLFELRANRNFRVLILPPNFDEESMLAGGSFRDYVSQITNKLPENTNLSDLYDVVIIQDWGTVRNDVNRLKELLRSDDQAQQSIQTLTDPTILRGALDGILDHRMMDMESGNYGFLEPRRNPAHPDDADLDDIAWLRQTQGFLPGQILIANLVDQVTRRAHERKPGEFVYSVLYKEDLVKKSMMDAFEALPPARKQEILEWLQEGLELTLQAAASLGGPAEVIPLEHAPYTQADLETELKTIYGRGPLTHTENFVDFTLLFAGGYFDMRLSPRALDFILREDNGLHEYLVDHPLAQGIVAEDGRVISSRPPVTPEILEKIMTHQEKLAILKSLFLPQKSFSGNILVSDLDPESPFSFANPKTQETVRILLTEINPEAHFLVLWPSRDDSILGRARAEFAGLNLHIVPFDGSRGIRAIKEAILDELPQFFNQTEEDRQASSLVKFDDFLSATSVIAPQEILDALALSSNVNKLNSLQGHAVLDKYREEHHGGAIEQEVVDFDIILGNAINAARGNPSRLRKQIPDENLVFRGDNDIWSLHPNALVLELVSGILASWAAARQMAQAA